MRFDKHLLLEDEKTEFYETASMLGVICPPSLAKKVREIVYNYKNTSLDEIKSALEDCQKLAGSGGYDWSSQGVASLKAVKMGEARVLDIFALLSGMYDFRVEIVESNAKGKLYFIHNNIEKWYELEGQVLCAQASRR